ncbi:ASCH domain-containing protein [Hassallia byssoidea VB512170]|uniref:ASCH domain-containing protein n=1 Tax=Hassallia byssoidea VB512170 TaxID=1304833 RepID=A0A846HL81_9CYAN|nr:ASCH domain-containing protein [Hassalia byssoidea]NEU77349.1 ASCH domain-containing protein [Hassalia byssoidea VB512170]
MVGTQRSRVWIAPLPLKDCLLLPTPTALSSLNSLPWLNKFEVKLKDLGLIQCGEVANPELLEVMFGLPMGYSSPVELKAETAPPAAAAKPSVTQFASKLRSALRSLLASLSQPDNGYSTSTNCVPKESTGNYSTSTDSHWLAISLWQPWASLIPLGLKHYETRTKKTNYRGKLLICSTATHTAKQYQQYFKICEELQLPPWEKTNFPCGCAIAILDLVDCIEMTAEFIAQQSATQILCGDWRRRRYVWKLENIQPLTESFAVKGKQGLFNISLAIQDDLKELLQRLNNGCSDSKQLLGCIENSPSNDAEQFGIPTSKDSPSTDGEQSNLHPSKNSPSTKRRHWGEGNGTIHWRTITKNGKDYPQAYYHWKENGKKRSKYINQQLIRLVQEAEDQKRPVIEILGLLGVVPAQVPKTLLGCIESSPSNNAEQLGIPTSKDSPSTSDGQLSVPTSKDIPSKTRRNKGSGTGSIQWKVITRNGKDYPQAWYHYEFWKNGVRQVKKSRYIPKRLLGRIEKLEAEKAPVREILSLLGVKW